MANSLLGHDGNGRTWSKNFWQFNIGNLVAVIALLGSLTVFLLNFERRLTKIENTEDTIADAAKRLDTAITRIDSQGTFAGQLAFGKHVEALKAQTDRLERDEQVLRELTPKMERVVTQMEWLLKEQKKDPPRP
jgi:hypothetical protein